jgi:single-strand DNA-binding protein
MSANINSNNYVQLRGRLGKDPEIKSFENNKIMARFAIATNESYTTMRGDRVENVTWHNITAWGDLAKKVEAECKKGMAITVVAKLVNNTFDGPDGKSRKVINIVASEVEVESRAGAKANQDEVQSSSI